MLSFLRPPYSVGSYLDKSIKNKEDESITYQGVEITRKDTDLLTNTTTILATNGWEQSESASFGHTALSAICQRFQILEATSIDCVGIQEECMG